MSSVRAKIGPGGRLVIPVAQRRELGLEVGDLVVISVENDELRIVSLDQRVKRIQALVRKHNPGGERLSESLIRDRRAEAARD
jgi:bifunctional DNA-binding transcriptional regulator/antitoxin component of YhaV-PrlF toxin-antitoxin module